jgi:YhcH/YjgK/YiaL family protein
MKAAITDYGEYNLGKPKWYANLHGYLTLPESECCWENHKHTIDIQYLINGKERIRWTSVNQLSTPRRYIEDKDRQEFDMPGFDTSQLTMEPGMFALFLPGDAHCPKIVFEEPEYLRKLVIKIPVDLLEK